jgi:hypothetical protein
VLIADAAAFVLACAVQCNDTFAAGGGAAAGVLPCNCNALVQALLKLLLPF